MPRRARISLPNIVHHVIQRGNNRQACFFNEQDYLFYLEWLEEYAKEYECDIHAYVLMTNHVHLLMTPRQSHSVSQLMKRLGQRYVQYINRTYQRSGTLWEGRFKSCLAHDETYVMSCYRYIELNPVRASMVSDPNDYRWSSHVVNAMGKSSDLITAHRLYTALGVNKPQRLNAYRELFSKSMDKEQLTNIRQSTNGNFVLGSESFKEQIAKILNRRVTPAIAGRPKKMSNVS